MSYLTKNFVLQHVDVNGSVGKRALKKVKNKIDGLDVRRSKADYNSL